MPRDTNSGRSRPSAPLEPAAPAGSLTPAIELWPIDNLRPYERNSRTHSSDQEAQLAESIDQFGMVGAIVVRNGVIGKGHGTLGGIRMLFAAGKRLYPMPGRHAGAEPYPAGVVPVLRADGWSDEQFRAFIIADNKLALNAGWNDEMLRLELADLSAGGFDMPLIGFDPGELADLSMTPTRVAMADPDEVPQAPRIPISEVGDLWILGEHRLFCGDCTSVEAADAVGAAECAAIVTDPPYGIGYDYAEHDDSDNAANAQLVADAFTLGPEVRIWTPGANNLARDRKCCAGQSASQRPAMALAALRLGSQCSSSARRQPRSSRTM
jgi:ParB-like chromosome segregation protein Spo0J